MPVRDILISSAVCLACLLLAFVSQWVAPGTAAASTADPVQLAVMDNRTLSPSAGGPPGSGASSTRSGIQAPLEVDPEDPNPFLFAMADSPSPANVPVDSLLADASALGGPISAPKERVTASGLGITDLEEGSGAEAVAGQTVSVNYRGSLTNGKEFDSSYGRGPFSFRLGGGQVIRGWDEGVAGMKVGGKRRLVIPPDLGYGSRGAGGVIPPDATLLFEVELLKVGG